ncbi:MAG: hypothetical protein KC931_17735, partial [Candidatus Omnitrophica bacterium]|nr:hypothetical protein [Candidatus Omnitrophota bacterium]
LNTKAMWERYQGLTKMGQSEIARAKREIESAPSSPMVALESVEGVISSLDERGAWVEDLTFPNTVDYMNNPPEKFRGIRTATFLKNANLLIDAIESAREGEKKLE